MAENIIREPVKYERPPEDWIGFIDYKVDFDHPETGVSFHWWENLYTTKHYHNHFEFFIITKGKANHIMGDSTSLLQKNTMCFIKPNDTHQIIASGDQPCRHINIAVTVDRLMRMCDALTPDMRRILEETEHFSTVLFEAELEYYQDHAEQINMCKNNYKDGSDAAVLLINEMLLHALSILYRRKQKVRTDYPDWFAELLAKLRSSEYFSYSLADVYKLTNYSPPVLLKYFKQYTGETMIAFLTRVKINYACGLLETTNFTTLDIAGKLGYSSLSHFNKVFKQYAGSTPSEYRKLCQSREASPRACLKIPLIR